MAVKPQIDSIKFIQQIDGSNHAILALVDCIGIAASSHRGLRAKTAARKTQPCGTRAGMLDEPDPTVQAQGAFGLGQHGAEAASAVPALARTLKSPNVLVRQNCCLALGDIGPAALQAKRELLQALSDPEWAVRRQAAITIGKINPPLADVEPALQKTAGDENPSVQKAAREALDTLRGSK